MTPNDIPKPPDFLWYPLSIWQPLPLDHSDVGTLAQRNQVVLHISEGGSAAGIYATFLSSKKPNRVSSHFAIDRDGTVYQYVSLDRTAWHARTAAGYGTCYCAAIDGTTIWVLWIIQYGSPTPAIHGIAAVSFDTSAGTWGTVTEYSSPTPGVTGIRSVHDGIELTIEMQVRAPSDYMVVFSGPNETVSTHNWGRVYYAQFDGSTWWSAVELPGQSGLGNDYYFMAHGVAVESMRTHILFEGFTSTGPNGNSSTLYHVAIDTDGVTFGSVSTLTSDLGGSSGGKIKTASNAIIFLVSGVPYLGIAGLTLVSSGPNVNTTVFYSAPLNSTPLTPTFTGTPIASGDWGTNPDLPSDSVLDQGILLAASYSNGQIMVAWPFSLDSSGTGSAFSYVMAAAAASPTWGARVDASPVPTGGETWNANQIGIVATSSGFGLLGMSVGGVVNPGQQSSQFSLVSLGGPTLPNYVHIPGLVQYLST